jgi:hypothetical protein
MYLLAQAELFAAVMKGFPVWDMAGFIGSTVWIIIVGIIFINKKQFSYDYQNHFYNCTVGLCNDCKPSFYVHAFIKAGAT